MQEDFICSPINRQIGCKQYTSDVVGGPVTTTLPVCSILVSNDDCTLGNITYNIANLADFYGKRMVIIKTVDTTATGFKIRLISPSSNFISTGSTTLNLPDLPSTTELVFPIGAGSEIGVSSYDVASGSTINIYTADGTIGGVRTVNLNGQIITFQGTGNDFFQVQGVQEIDIDARLNISIQTPQLIIVPQFPLDNTVDDIVVQDPGTGQIKRRSAATIGGSNAIFSVGQNPVTAAYPAVNTTNDIVGLDVSSPLNHTGYNSGAINLVSGVFSPPTLDKYQVILKIGLKNSAVQGRWILQLYCITDLQNVSQSEQWNANSPNTFQDFYLHDCLILDPAKTYKFRVRDLTALGISSYANTTVMLNYA